MPTYWVNKRRYSEKAGRHPRYQPWVWDPLAPPFRDMKNLPTSRVGFRGLVSRILQRHGTGRYLILREQFEGEKPGYRPVVYFFVRADGRYKILKRYTQYPSHPHGKVQCYFKQHRRRLRLTMDIGERMRERRRALLEKITHRVEPPKPFKYKIKARYWTYERK